MKKSMLIAALFICASCEKKHEQILTPQDDDLAVPQNLETKEFRVCGQLLQLEVADEDGEREIGMMYRTKVPEGTGMLFSFRRPRVLRFWMQNVPMDLDIGYFDERGELIKSYTMTGTSPLERSDGVKLYSSEGPAQFAVEVGPGFFSRHGKSLETCNLLPLPPAGE